MRRLRKVHNVKAIDPYASLIGAIGMEQKSRQVENEFDYPFDPNPIWDSMRNFTLPSGGVLVRGREIKFPIAIEPTKKPTKRVPRRR